MLEYRLYIIDREFSDTYEYIGYFKSRQELGQFIAENERAGNSVTILSCGGYVPIAEIPSDHF